MSHRQGYKNGAGANRPAMTKTTENYLELYRHAVAAASVFALGHLFRRDTPLPTAGLPTATGEPMDFVGSAGGRNRTDNPCDILATHCDRATRLHPTHARFGMSSLRGSRSVTLEIRRSSEASSTYVRTKVSVRRGRRVLAPTGGAPNVTPEIVSLSSNHPKNKEIPLFFGIRRLNLEVNSRGANELPNDTVSGTGCRKLGGTDCVSY
jgi:hypothetical protein